MSAPSPPARPDGGPGFAILPLRVVAVLLAAAVVAVGAVRLSGVDIREPDAAAVSVRELRFEDRPDGSIEVLDGRTGARVDTITGEAGFVRGTLRALARERKRAGGGPERPFELIGRADGRLTLRDPDTGRLVDLEAFGPTNAGAFARLMTLEPGTGR
jgi:putative photosynthetic complex assembly protein